ncbi:MAG: biotin/lipoyl-binding protein [Saprospiraceae bacterium]|nr:biotin/lipoyl-binding protein [Saprospiraceae bacterium]
MYQAVVKGFGKITIEQNKLDDLEVIYDENGIPAFVILGSHKYKIHLIGIPGAAKQLIFVDGMPFEVELLRDVDLQMESLGFNRKRNNEHKIIHAPMPGHVIRVEVEEGLKVSKGSELLTLEAMKMENVVQANEDGTIKKIFVKTGQTVSKGDSLIELE